MDNFYNRVNIYCQTYQLYRKAGIPEKISNNHVYIKYFVYGHEIKLTEDFYYMTEQLWKFLFAIYGGGPIMKKSQSLTTKTNLALNKDDVKKQHIVVPDFYEKQDWEENSFAGEKNENMSYDISIETNTTPGTRLRN